MKDMYIKVIETDSEFDRVKNEWLNFEKKVNNQNITSSYIWQRTWWRHFKDYEPFGYNKKLCILFLYNKENILRAIASFCEVTRKHRGIRYKTIEFIAQQWGATYLDIISDGLSKEDFNFIFDWLKKNRKYDVIELKYIPEFTPNFDLYKGNITVLSACPEINLEPYASYDEFNMKVYNSNLRRNIKVRARKLKNDLEGEIRCINSAAEFAQLWEDVKRVSKSKEEDLKHSLYNDHQKSSFLEDISSLWNPLSCVVVFAKGELIGYQIGYLARNKKYFFDLSYDRSYRQYGIGKIIDDFEVQLGFKRNYNLCMGTGVGLYKLDYKPELVRICTFLKRGNTLKGMPLYFLRRKLNQRVASKFEEELKINLQRLRKWK